MVATVGVIARGEAKCNFECYAYNYSQVVRYVCDCLLAKKRYDIINHVHAHTKFFF